MATRARKKMIGLLTWPTSSQTGFLSVRVGYDPVNQAIVYTHSNSEANSGGYATTSVLSYNLRQGAWSTDVPHFRQQRKSDCDRHFYRERLSIPDLLRGQLPLGCGQSNDWRLRRNTFYGAGRGRFRQDDHGMEITAHSESTINANIYVSRANEDIPLADLISGTSLSASGTMQFAVGSSVRTSLLRKLSVTRARLAAARCQPGAHGIIR